jgi:diguanylate cyclase (GGDEF)-like protein/PAS domain S-box-containing protein
MDLKLPASLKFFPRLPRQQRGVWDEIDSERVLRVLMRNLDGMIFRCAIDNDWTIHFASDGASALTGYTPDELRLSRQVSLERLTHPEDREAVRDVIMRAISDGMPYRIEYRIICRDGSEKWVRERGSCVIDELGSRVLEGFMEDVSDQVIAQTHRAEVELRYTSIFENSVVGIFQTTQDGRYLAANQALADLYGFANQAELIAGLSDIARSLYVDPNRRAEFADLIARDGRVRDFESEVYCRDGRRIWISENAHAVCGPDGTLLYYEGTVEDISERRRHQAELQYQATHDPLTGLPNRNLLEDRLTQAISTARRHLRQVAVVFVDLDNFKFINDSLGHAAGDRLLKTVSSRLVGSLRTEDTVARYGGDEFVLILSDQQSVGNIAQTLQRVQDAVRQGIVIDGHDLCVTCSIGAGMYPHDGEDLDTLLSNADAAMYHAKADGKGQFKFYTPALNQAAHERLAMETALRHAIEAGVLTVQYQPKINAGGAVCGCEALVRWHSTEFGAMSPARFIPLAEETGLIDPITDFVLRTACHDAVGWGDLHVAVNISARRFSSADLVQQVREVLQHSGLPAARLQLEITESMLVGNVDRSIETLKALKALGVRIAVDDFGTGYSSLAYLKRFPIDILKIDRSFVTGCDHDEEAMAIARAIMRLGHSLGMEIVAEGVEHPAEHHALLDEGCEEFQGFLFSRPIAALAMPDFCQQRLELQGVSQ